MTFTSFNLHSRVLAGIPKTFVAPTPIQEQAIPSVMQGHDLLGLAQTGTGKTAAFVLPILNRLIDGKRGKVRAVIIAPTRELAEQINDCVEELGARSGLRSTTIYGGMRMSGQVRRLRDGVDIVVACPGRLLDHIQQRTVDLREVEVLVLDEADQMFDMGFLPTIRRVLAALPKTRQNLLFSATMPSEIRGLANEILNKPQVVQIGDRTPPKTVSHAIYAVEQSQKSELLLKLLQSTDSQSVLIFTRTKHRAKSLGEMLEKSGYSATSLQGNLSQQRRQKALAGFKDGKFQILVATDIAARGIDVQSVSHVINYDMPGTVEAYTHRIGRTGRAERTGDALTFVTREDRFMLRSIERTLGAAIEQKVMEGFKPTMSLDSNSGGDRNRSFRRPQRRDNNGDNRRRDDWGGGRSRGGFNNNRRRNNGGGSGRYSSERSASWS